ncbi:MAG TPA: sodium:alanine symporter family protein [Acidobacteriota bacterium]|nr:sodium:alanine symporter family protein [Acidobacteriota bacterium]
METVEYIIQTLTDFITSYIVPEELIIVTLLGTGLFLTLRLGFIQLRRFKHGVEVATGRFDNPEDPGDVTHFQALTTALSATVGIGNIAGVATAIHWGGPGALFWMWMTAFFGMAVKYSEVTLALKYRKVEARDETRTWMGTVSGGPMYSIEYGIREHWKVLSVVAKPMAILFAFGLMLTSFLTGNAIQANTISDMFSSEFGINPWIVGLTTSTFIAIVIFGGIRRIGRVTSILAPLMAAIYVLGALVILFFNAGEVLPTLSTIFTEAFNPTAGVAGTGAGVFLTTILWGVKRGLFSNEAGQGSAPIAHSAAQTEEPVSEGVVALLEPFIDTLVICTLTGLVLLTTGVWSDTHPTTMDLASGDATYILYNDFREPINVDPPQAIIVVDSVPVYEDDHAEFAWHDVAVERFYVDEAQTQPFSGRILAREGKAVDDQGQEHFFLYGPAVDTGAPLTAHAFSRGLGSDAGRYIVLLCVALFAVSTAISWSYYGDRCANYIFGPAAIIPFKCVFIGFHLMGAVASLNVIWDFGDVALSIVTIPNLISLLLLAGVVAKTTRSYFDRRPWLTQGVNRPKQE